MSVAPKILIIRGGAIGDFILTLPAITAVRRQFPDAHLEILGYPHIAQLAVAAGLVDRAQPIEARGLAPFFARNGELAEDMADYFSGFNLIISYLYDPDEFFFTNVRRCTPAQFIAGPHRPDEKQKLHATKVFLKPLERLAIFEADTIPRLPLSPPPSPLSPLLALHPGSGSETKNWPEPKWAELMAQLLATTELDLLLVGGEAEGDRLKRLTAQLRSSRCHVAQSLPLPELAKRLQTCVGFVGHDSGITHLAAAVGLPCVVLWADTIEEIWHPQGQTHVLIRAAKGIHEISVEQVLKEIRSLVK